MPRTEIDRKPVFTSYFSRFDGLHEPALQPLQDAPHTPHLLPGKPTLEDSDRVEDKRQQTRIAASPKENVPPNWLNDYLDTLDERLAESDQLPRPQSTSGSGDLPSVTGRSPISPTGSVAQPRIMNMNAATPGSQSTNSASGAEHSTIQDTTLRPPTGPSTSGPVAPTSKEFPSLPSLAPSPAQTPYVGMSLGWTGTPEMRLGNGDSYLDFDIQGLSWMNADFYDVSANVGFDSALLEPLLTEESWLGAESSARSLCMP